MCNIAQRLFQDPVNPEGAYLGEHALPICVLALLLAGCRESRRRARRFVDLLLLLALSSCANGLLGNGDCGVGIGSRRWSRQARLLARRRRQIRVAGVLKSLSKLQNAVETLARIFSQRPVQNRVNLLGQIWPLQAQRRHLSAQMNAPVAPAVLNPRLREPSKWSTSSGSSFNSA